MAGVPKLRWGAKEEFDRKGDQNGLSVVSLA